MHSLFLIVYVLDLQKQSKTYNLINSPQMKSITPPYTVSQYILCSIGIFLLGIGITVGSLLSVPHLLESIGIHG